MKFNIYNQIISILTVVATLSMFVGCRDDLNSGIGEMVEEGLPATVTLKVSVPKMSIRTREAGSQPSEANRINNLWVAIFDKNTGRKTGEATIEYSQQVEEGGANPAASVSLEVPTVSGKAYIVGVANAKNKYSALAKSPDSDQIESTSENLWTMLQEIDTWDQYKSLITYLSNPTSVGRQGSSSFLMSGVFIKGGLENTHVSVNEDDNLVTIEKGNHDLDGYIHLRRMDAYNKFEVYPAENIKIEPVSWQVMNMPGLSFVKDRHVEYDASDIHIHPGNEFQGYEGASYHNSEEFGPQLFESIENNGYSFDFYLRENKKTGILNSSDGYNDREREHKIADTGLNTGWYKSLVSTTGETVPAIPTQYNSTDVNNLWKNNATFVVLNLKVSYWCEEKTETDGTLTYKPTDEGTGIYRTAIVSYTVHLGYCDDSVTGGKVNDFNCNRNTQYTYKVYVEGVDKIRVEAISESEEEPQPGAEGMVTDLTEGDLVSLDSHYCVLNIALSDAERKNLMWRIQSPFGDETIDMVGGNTHGRNFGSSITNTASDENVKSALSKNQFYNWIQIRPTSAVNTIAAYTGDPRLVVRGVTAIDVLTGENGVWYLDDLCNPDGFRHPDLKLVYDYAATPEQKKEYDDWIKSDDLSLENLTKDVREQIETSRYYTLFIDEYVYEYVFNGDLTFNGAEYDEDLSQWSKYVNADDRKLWLTTNVSNVSADGESSYSKAKYLISQESIQSYYSPTRSHNGIGIESTNESYIYLKNALDNISTVWTFDGWDTGTNGNKNPNNPNGEAYNNSNGLVNQWNYVKDGRKTWAQVIQYKDNNSKTMSLRKGVKDKKNSTTDDQEYYIPEHYNDFLNACLARNRDLNNNGKIDLDEVRWYLPTDETYTRMMLGAVSLRSPLFAAKEYAPDEIKAGTGKPYSHYAGSNNRQLWAEELESTGWLKCKGGEMAGNLRCVRNIGVKNGVIPEGENAIQQAYRFGDEPNTIELEFYRSAALREFTADFLDYHSVIDMQAFAARKFKYAKSECIAEGTNRNLSPDYDRQTGEYDKILKLNNGRYLIDEGYIQNQNQVLDEKGWTNSLHNNSICGYYYEEEDYVDAGTWRVPNITELSIMLFLGIIDDSQVGYVSSTYERFAGRNNYYMGLTFYDGKKDVTANVKSSKVLCVKDIQTSY